MCVFCDLSSFGSRTKKNTQLVNCTKVELCFICNIGRHSPKKSNLIGIKNEGPEEHVFRLLSNMAGRFWGIHSFHGAMGLAMAVSCGVQGAIEGPTGMLQCWHYKKWCFPKAWRRAFHSAALGFSVHEKWRGDTPKMYCDCVGVEAMKRSVNFMIENGHW